jgi:hypothetical protein
MLNFLLGFIAGIFANQVFAMLSRLLPDKWVRYGVLIGELEKQNTLGVIWISQITLTSPSRWRRALMLPLIEYLIAEVRFNNGEWIKTRWQTGDVNIAMLRADGLMTIPVVILTYSGSQSYLGDNIQTNLITDSGIIELRIIRSVDKQEAAIKRFYFNHKTGDLKDA